MAATRKRSRDNMDEPSRAECPFSIRHVDLRERDLKKKRRRSDDAPGSDNPKIPVQMSPFAATGKFKTYETMDIHYAVEPSKRWSEMTRYNSFVLNGSKYFSDNYVFVANESTVESQKFAPSGGQAGPRTHSNDDWVARILEIRARDEHHVYARVYWMYWPDELPPNTLDGKKYVSGRQRYHGQNELIASNHMDIINVVSVTQQATVNQVTDENDDQIQSALYWRQALDIRAFELSTVDRVCRCNEPGNPDKVLVECPNENCSKWLHGDCLQHELLMSVWEELGANRPYIAPSIKAEKEEEETKRPLSPIEPSSATVATEPPIQVKIDSEADLVKASDTINVKDQGEIAAKGSAQSQDGRISTTQTPTKEPPHKSVGRRLKKVDDIHKPYEGLFEAKLKPENDIFEIKDLRVGVEGGQKTWLKEINCLVCGSGIH